MSRRLTHALWPIGTAALLSACADADSAGPALTRDSAGITIVENSSDLLSPDRQWRLETPAATRIGVVMGDPVYELAQVQGAVRLADGSIVVAVAASEEVRAYNASGNHLWSAGGRGDGPGEFRNLRKLLRTTATRSSSSTGSELASPDLRRMAGSSTWHYGPPRQACRWACSATDRPSAGSMPAMSQ